MLLNNLHKILIITKEMIEYTGCTIWKWWILKTNSRTHPHDNSFGSSGCDVIVTVVPIL